MIPSNRRQIAGIVILCAILSAASVLVLSQARAGGDIPYIYYYFQDQFIVQRADGSDTLVLADYQLPERQTQIRGAGWSHSGRWFTWMSRGAGGGRGPHNLYVVGREGQQRSTVLPQEVAIVLEVTWSPPTEELLLIRFGEPSVATQSVVIYDPAVQQIVFEVRGNELNPRTLETLLAAEWSPDGSMVAVVDNASRQLMLIESDGFQILQTVSAVGSNFTGTPYAGLLPQWFNDDTLLYLSADQNALMVHKVRTDEVTTIELPFTDTVYRVFKSPDGQYALLYTLSSEYVTDLWLISLNDAQVSLIQENVSTVSFFRNGVPLPQSQWSENGYAFFLDYEQKMRRIAPTDQTQELIVTPLEGRVLYGQGFWTPQSTLVFTIHSVELGGYQTYEYDPETEQLTLLDPEDPDELSREWIFSLSNLGYQAYNNFVEDPATGERFPFAMQRRNLRLGSVVVAEDVRWHPSEAWFFLVSWQIEDLRLINVANLDSSIQRELGLCPEDSVTCFGWLPSAISR